MAGTTKQSARPILINIGESPTPFKWQMVFNSFDVTKIEMGCLVRLAYVVGSSAAEIVTVVVSIEGLVQLKESAKSYLQDFSLRSDYHPIQVPGGVKQFSPLFANYVRLARSGKTGEIALLTVQLHEIANAASGVSPKEKITEPVQVALLHSDMDTHQRLVIEMLDIK